MGAVLARHGYDTVHWSNVGDPKAADPLIMAYARADHRVVFTHDLDFGTLLALTHAAGPSVLQFCGQNTLPDHAAGFIIAAIRYYEMDSATGALVVVDERTTRVRVLPI